MQNDKFTDLNHNKAYTLIETLVVFVIIGILFSLGYAAYRDFGRRQELAGIAKVIEGKIRKAQQSALSGVKPDSERCNPPQTLISYNFYVVSSNHYQIQASCSGGLPVIVDDVTIPDSTTITLAQNPIAFKVLGTGTNVDVSTNIILTQIATGKTYSITVDSGGSVK